MTDAEKIAALQQRVEELEYALKRFHEARANAPDWEKLWAEQTNRVEELEAQIMFVTTGEQS